MTIPQLFRVAALRWRSLWRSADLDAEFDRELSFHLDQLIQEKLAEGVSLAEAQRSARRELGNLTIAKDAARDHRRTRWAHDLWRDLGYGWRRLRAAPVSNVVGITCLAVGIGANAALLTAIDGVMRRTVHWPSADRVVIVRGPTSTGELDRVAIREYLAWRNAATTLESAAVSFQGPREFGAPASDQLAEIIDTSAVTPDWFATLGVQPLEGRLFTDAEQAVGSPTAVMVIGHRLWERRYGRDPHIVGRIERVNAVDTTIVGVLPADYRYQDRRIQAWFPLRLDARRPAGNRPTVTMIARLRPGVTVDDARTDLQRMSAEVPGIPPTEWNGVADVRPLAEALYAWAVRPLVILEVAVALVLAVICLNLTALLISRNAVRQREIAMRMALGAGPGRVVRQLFAEHLIMAGMGAVVGLLIAWWGLPRLTALISSPLGSPQLTVTRSASSMAGAIIVLSVVCGVVIGLLPALAGMRQSALSALTIGLPAVHTTSTFRMRGALVALQIAMSMVLLMSAGLMSKSIRLAEASDVGFDSGDLMALRFHTESPDAANVITRVFDALKNVHGVESVGGASDPPLNNLGLPQAVATPEAASRGDARLGLRANYFLVTPGYFATMRAKILSGRELTAADNSSSSRAIVVNEAAAQALWPDVDPLGQRVLLETNTTRSTGEVVGVVRNLRLLRWQDRIQPIVYASYLQHAPASPGPFADITERMTFLLRHKGPAEAIARQAQQAIARIEPLRPIIYLGPVGEPGVFFEETRTYTHAVTLSAVAATFLAALGLYGVVNNVVVQRTTEIGIRVALGSPFWRILYVVCRPSLAAAVSGLLLGVAGALTLPRQIALPYGGVQPADPATLTTAVMAIVAIVILACILPARRATWVDPARTLRVD
jgi:predicted permease